MRCQIFSSVKQSSIENTSQKEYHQISRPPPQKFITQPSSNFDISIDDQYKLSAQNSLLQQKFLSAEEPVDPDTKNMISKLKGANRRRIKQEEERDGFRSGEVPEVECDGTEG